MESRVIVIAGKKYKPVVNLNTIRDFMKFSGVKPEELQRKPFTIDQAIGLVYFSIKEGCRIEKRKMTITPEDVGAVINFQTVKMMNEMIRDFGVKNGYIKN